MDEINQLIDLLKTKTQLVAMVAPSFPIVYDYPQIVTRLRKLGFTYVVEVAAGAMYTNQQVRTLLFNNPQGRFITSPCPSFVRLVRQKYPQLEKFLAFNADSPMIATAKMVKQTYPNFKSVFIGPCIVKKKEASEDHPELDILVITYKELEEAFRHFNLPPIEAAPGEKFDISAKETRFYPMDGGLTYTSGVNQVLKPEEYRIVSGWQKCAAALEEFANNPQIRFLDVLFCEGGCINGPGVVSKLTIEERKQKLSQFYNSAVTEQKPV